MPRSTGSLVTSRRAFLSGLAGAALLGAPRAFAQSSATPIRIGMSTVLSGPASALGTGMKAGIEACFAEVNASGGVFGRPLELTTIDDAYEPARCAANMRTLIDEKKVFAVLGNVGTPTAAVAVPIANEKRVPFFGAFTGAGLLRKRPPDRYVVNVRASYAQETAEMVRGLVGDLGIHPEKLAFFTQDDAYGESGHAGAVAALQAIGFPGGDRLTHGRYARNTTDVEGALAKVLDPRSSPRAVIMVGAYAPCAKFIRMARKQGLSAVFVNVSFVGSDALAAALGPDGEGVVVTQVVPHYDAELPVVRDYRRAMPAEGVNFVSLEGFVAARAFVAALREAGPDADRERFIDAIESGHPFDLGLEEPSVLSRDDHQFSDRVWLTCIRGGRFVPLRAWRELDAGGRRP